VPFSNKGVNLKLKILVTGASGLLGSKVVQELQLEGHQVIPTSHSKSLYPTSIILDITQNKDVYELITKTKPNIIVHAAAETKVDLCEKQPEYAHKVNVQGTRNIAKACQKAETKLIYISTDYVFNGETGNYIEEDKTNPINTYGLTKLQGERETKNNCKNYLILRTSVNFGWHQHKSNFATWIIASLRQGKTINVVTDHYNTPTLTDNLAQVIVETIEKDVTGVYHTSGSERISRYNFARKIAEIFNLNPKLIKLIKMKDLETSGIWLAKRPADSSLSIFKIQNVISTKILNVEEALKIMKRQKAQLHT